MDNKNNNKGFSLMELLVCLAISGFVILSAFSFIMVGMDNYKKTSKTTSLQQEVSFTDNIFGEAIRDSSQATVYIKYYMNGTNDIELHTGKKVIYYSAGANSVFVYREADFDASNPAKSDNLVTKYADTLNIKFVNADGDTTLEAAHTSTDADGNTIITAYSRLVKVTAEFSYKEKSSKSEVTYQIRNK